MRTQPPTHPPSRIGAAPDYTLVPPHQPNGDCCGSRGGTEVPHVSIPRALPQVLRQRQAEHMAGVLRQVASGRLGGRRCGRVLAVVGAGGAGRVRQALEGAGSG